MHSENVEVLIPDFGYNIISFIKSNEFATFIQMKSQSYHQNQAAGRNSLPTIFSAALKAIAAIVKVGFTPTVSGKTDPSIT
jgi:hypothetical protein